MRTRYREYWVVAKRVREEAREKAAKEAALEGAESPMSDLEIRERLRAIGYVDEVEGVN